MSIDFKIEEIDGRKVCIGGIGKMFYQDGFPISMAIKKFRESNVEVSVLHIADELLKQGDFGIDRKTGEIRAYTLIKDQLQDSNIDGVDMSSDITLVYHFCYSNYEQQREMIFQYLFGGEETAKTFLREKIK